jgi:vitamin B12 transporter
MRCFLRTAGGPARGAWFSNSLASLRILCCAVALLAGSPQFATSQSAAADDDPLAAADDPQPPAADAVEPADRIAEDLAFPEIPETTVIGRLGPFPGSPLSEGTVLTPTRGEASASEIGSSLTVITADQIRQTRQTRVTEVLRTVPGLDVVQSGGRGQTSSVFLRGANSYQTKVMIDGIPVNDPSGPQRGFDFGLLSVDGIQQIEVLRGPQSTLYGSDAMGGVINIVTQRGEGPASVVAGFEGGSFGTTREQLNVSGGTACYHYAFGGSYETSSGFSAAEIGTENDGFRAANYAGRLGWTPADDFDIDCSFRYIDQNVDLDDFNADNLTAEARSDNFFNRVQARWMTLDGFWEHRLAFNLANHDRRYPGGWVPHYLGQTRKVEYLSNFYLGSNHTVTAGVDYWHEEASNTNTPQQSQYLTGLYIQDQIRLLDCWFTTVGVRFDEHSTAGPAETYRITSRYHVAPTGTAFHGSLGTGFRAPTLFELFSPYGNLGLDPEKNFGWDCGVEQAFLDGRVVVDGTYFRSDYTNLIEFAFLPGPPWGQYQNAGETLTSGVELTARWELSSATTLHGSYTHTLARQLSTGNLLLRRPPHKAAQGVAHRFDCDRARLNLSLLYIGPREDLDDSWPSNRVTLGEYYLLNLAGSYDINHWCQLYARIDNVLNENYQEVWSYQTAPLSGYAGVSIRL